MAEDPPPLLSHAATSGLNLNLKRRRATSAPCENGEERMRKRTRGNLSSDLMKESIIEEHDEDDGGAAGRSSSALKGKGKEREPPPLSAAGHPSSSATAAVIEDLAQELKCGCCTELCYNPVIVNPCQHYFCGSCCILWIRNGGTNCPACRSVSTSVTPSRILQSLLDLLLRADPARARTPNERAQADQVYRAGTSLRLPTPRPATPQPNFDAAADTLARPCPTCLPGNAYGWCCPTPIPDPAADPEHALDLDDGMPPGHGFCGHCDQLHNVRAPTSSACDLCRVSFCGVGIQGRCCALGMVVQQPQGMAELQDVLLSGAVYDCFQRNSVEIDILVDYLRVNEISLRAVYKEIIAHLLQTPTGFAPLIAAGVFDDLHAVAGADDTDPAAPRRKICRLCAAQVLIHELRAWWVRERRQGGLPPEVSARKDCAEGSLCERQSEQAHAREYNHIIQPPAPAEPAPPLSVPPSPPSDFDPLGAVQADPAPDVDMRPPPPRLPPPPPHTSSQAEVEALMASAASGSASHHAEAPPIPPQENGDAGGDIVMAEAEAEDGIPQPQPDPDPEMLGSKTPRAAHALSAS